MPMLSFQGESILKCESASQWLRAQSQGIRSMLFQISAN